MRIVQTLCLIYQHPRILLGMKKRGFGQGRWNGFGGKVMAGEKIEDAVKREVGEEIGVVVNEIQKFGRIIFEFQDKTDTIEVHFFKTNNFNGEPAESDEMKPAWFNIKEIPFDKMWPDDKYWVPLFLKDKKFTGKFVFNNNDEITEYKLDEVEQI